MIGDVGGVDSDVLCERGKVEGFGRRHDRTDLVVVIVLDSGVRGSLLS